MDLPTLTRVFDYMIRVQESNTVRLTEDEAAERMQELIAAGTVVIIVDDQGSPKAAMVPVAPIQSEKDLRIAAGAVDIHVARDPGQEITDAINEDPEEVARLRQARSGATTPLAQALGDEDPTRGAGWCAPSP